MARFTWPEFTFAARLIVGCHDGSSRFSALIMGDDDLASSAFRACTRAIERPGNGRATQEQVPHDRAGVQLLVAKALPYRLCQASHVRLPDRRRPAVRTAAGRSRRTARGPAGEIRCCCRAAACGPNSRTGDAAKPEAASEVSQPAQDGLAEEAEDEELADGHCIRCQVIGYLLALSLCFALHEINRVNPLALRAMSVVFNSVFNSAV